MLDRALRNVHRILDEVRVAYVALDDATARAHLARLGILAPAHGAPA
jgi:hypothetical protein